MSNKPSIIAIIPARGGSKRIPKKNIRPFAGKPMISYSIQAALDAGLFDRVIVSTDSDEIADIAAACGAEVPFRRPPELSDDRTATAPVLLHALEWLAANGTPATYACCIYATAPFVRAADLVSGLEILKTAQATTAFSVTSFAFPIFRALKLTDEGTVAMFWPEHRLARSQDLPEAYHDAGQFYWLDVARFISDPNLYAADARPVVLPRHLVQDIDTPEDWTTAEHMYRAVQARDHGNAVSQTSFDELERKGGAALEAGDITNAIALLSEAAEIAPDNPAVLHNLGCAFMRAKRFDEAENALRRSVSTTNSPLTWGVLGELFDVKGKKSDAFHCYKKALKGRPNDYVLLTKLGALKELMGDKPGARDCYQAALAARPGDFHATSKYTALSFEKDPETAVRLLEDALANAGENLNRKAAILNQLLSKKEWWERIQRGEMPYHASRVDELFFKYAQPYALELGATHQARLDANPTNTSIIYDLGLAKFFLNQRHDAERLFERVPEKAQGTIYENIRFAPAFYDELRAFSDARLTQGLPPVLEIVPLVPDSSGILYLSCNFEYFRAFASPMIVSLCEHSPKTPVHVHIMDANEEETGWALAFLKQLAPLKFALTIERPGLENENKTAARCYYHAVRFIRYYAHLQHYGVPLWLMDVDALINRNLDGLFSRLDIADVSMRIRPGRTEPWNQFNACVVGAGTAERSLEYFKLVAAYLAYFFQKGRLRWGVDQLAMYGVFADMQDRNKAPSLALLDDKDVDYDYQDDGFVWCNSGVGKFHHLQRVAEPGNQASANFEGNKFVGVFEHYWNECKRITAAIPAP
jgi:pseudaminic acid cytidylyltransferase